MKIVSENHAACLTRYEKPDSTERLMLDAVACDLRSLYAETAADLPDDLLALADRLEGSRSPDMRAA